MRNSDLALLNEFINSNSVCKTSPDLSQLLLNIFNKTFKRFCSDSFDYLLLSLELKGNNVRNNMPFK